MIVCEHLYTLIFYCQWKDDGTLRVQSSIHLWGVSPGIASSDSVIPIPINPLSFLDVLSGYAICFSEPAFTAAFVSSQQALSRFLCFMKCNDVLPSSIKKQLARIPHEIRNFCVCVCVSYAAVGVCSEVHIQCFHSEHESSPHHPPSLYRNSMQ